MAKIFSARTRQKVVFLAVFVLLTSTFDASGRDVISKIPDSLKFTPTLAATAIPVMEYATHNQGNMQLMIGNNGTFGTEGGDMEDPLTGESVVSCVYPKYSNFTYLWVAALWVGAVVGRDTLVSVGNEDWYETLEFWPNPLWLEDTKETYGFQHKSIDVSSPYYDQDARSEQDIICEYDDTRTNVEPDFFDNRAHQPLYIKARQRSMAWSYDYADDFILFDYQIENIGSERLENVYMGIWIDGDVWHITNRDATHWTDDIVGFYRTHPAPEGCGFVDTIDIAYHADNDGDPNSGAWDALSPRSAIGVRVIRTPSDSLRYSYNWWIINYSDATKDFGPRRLGTPDDPFRDLGGRLGTPMGDRNKYYLLSHDEFDYDLLFTALDHSDEGWLPPPEDAVNFADGFDVRNLLSFGPFDIDPGETLPITFAWIGGEDFHVEPTDFEEYWHAYNPMAFYNRLNFAPLAKNSRWASWIYDNPGVDTDGNEYRGKKRTCCADSSLSDTGWVYLGCEDTWYEGDGVPDFRGASPPPAPEFWIEPDVGMLRVCFNGLISETTGDRFTNDVDFEGYRIYLARDNRNSSFSLIASYDKENYNKYIYNWVLSYWELLDPPFTPEALQEAYGQYVTDSVFAPQRYTQSNPFYHPDFNDSVFYFAPQDFNQSIFNVNTPIKKVYPDQPYPSSLDPSQADPEELTEEGRFKYFEYEFVIDDLLPTIPYYINVTAFDFGSPKVGLASLETPVANGAQVAYPLSSPEEVEQGNAKVFIYPNPYRTDAGYDELGLENRDGTESDDRMRRIHFANLPRVCKIYIYSLDGDLVRELDHDYPAGDPMSTHDTWDLITRNTQTVVSGLYYWVVESATGTQMGKLVIIK